VFELAGDPEETLDRHRCQAERQLVDDQHVGLMAERRRQGEDLFESTIAVEVVALALMGRYSYGWRMLTPVRSTVLMGFYFFPRGGSAQVARYLCRALAGSPWRLTLFSGSLGTSSDTSNAERFFGGIECRSLDYSPAKASWATGRDSMLAAVPMHASYEDRPQVADRVFVDLDDAAFNRQVTGWTKFLSVQTCTPSVLHLHHLTPIHEAAMGLWPDTPVVTHLHGTELMMLAAERAGRRSRHGSPFGVEWVERMRRWAAASDRLVVVSSHDRELAGELLEVDPERFAIVANGVDTEVFTIRVPRFCDHRARWTRWLVDDPRGWRPGGDEGSIRYEHDDLAAFSDDAGEPVPVVLFVGRFLRFKRLQLLIEAHHQIRSTTGLRSVLVIVGGFVGEWEGEHPYDTVQRLGAVGVYFVGWRDHHELAEILGCSDVLAAPAVDEPFGLVYLEAMAAGVPPIATDTGGPRSFINVDPTLPTGWLVAPDDVGATAAALAEAVSDPVGRCERGERAARYVAEKYSWTATAATFSKMYRDVIEERAPIKRQSEPTTSGVA